jgi:hypothetical protein
MTLQVINKEIKALSTHIGQAAELVHAACIQCQFMPNQIEILECATDKRFADYTPEEKAKKLTKKIMDIQFFLDIKDKYDKEYYVEITKFLCKQFPNTTLKELEIAIQLATAQKLNVETTTFNSFNAEYIAKILSAYAAYSQPIKIKFTSAIQLKIKEHKNANITDEEKEAIMRESVIACYTHYNKLGEIVDVKNLVYEYLVQRKLMKPTNEQKHESLKKAKTTLIEQYAIKREMATSLTDKRDLTLKLNLINNISNDDVSKDDELIAQAKKILLAEYFKSETDFINKINNQLKVHDNSRTNTPNKPSNK